MTLNSIHKILSRITNARNNVQEHVANLVFHFVTSLIQVCYKLQSGLLAYGIKYGISYLTVLSCRIFDYFLFDSALRTKLKWKRF